MTSTSSRRSLRPGEPEPEPEPPSPSPRPEFGAVAGILARCAENPSAFLALNAETCHFTVDGVDGVVAYSLAQRNTNRQVGHAFAHPAHQGELMAALLDLPALPPGP